MVNRFYKQVTVEPVEDGFEVRLDGRPIRSPKRAVMVVPARQLADLIAKEWAAQGEDIQPETMPLMRLAGGTVDRDDQEMRRLVDDIVKYGSSDLLCYRAEAPAVLVARQADQWQPLLVWAEAEFGLALMVTAGITAVVQPDASLEALRAHVEGLDRWRLAALYAAVPLCGSAILGLALLHGRLGPEEALAIACLDELWQEEQWGEDAEATARRQGLAADLTAASQFVRALVGPEASRNP